MSWRSRALEVAEELLRRHRGFVVSRRDGFVVVKLEVGGETWLVWVRSGPVTRRALELFERMVSAHEYDRLVLLKASDVADHVSFRRLAERGIEVMTPDEFP